MLLSVAMSPLPHPFLSLFLCVDMMGERKGPSRPSCLFRSAVFAPHRVGCPPGPLALGGAELQPRSESWSSRLSYSNHFAFVCRASWRRLLTKWIKRIFQLSHLFLGVCVSGTWQPFPGSHALGQLITMHYLSQKKCARPGWSLR